MQAKALGERVRLTEVGWDADLSYEISSDPLPSPTGAEVLVEIEACGVCHRDLIDRAGRWPFLRTPVTPGHEAAGRVIAVGSDVRDFRVGDRVGTMHRDACGQCAACKKGQTSICEGAAWVFGIMADGGYARHVVAPQSALFALPKTMPANDGAVMHCTFGTAYRDLIDRAGRWPFLRTPITPGHEAAGRVIAVGPDVRDFRVGDRVGTMHRDACGQCAACKKGQTSICEGAAWVFGIMADGGYARHVVGPESSLFALPKTIPANEAAILHCTFGTAYRDLKTLGKIFAGERVLITGANGGVGLAAVQIASRLGGEVVAVVRSAEHTELLTRLGAHRVVVDPGNTFHEKSLAAGIDLALEAVGHSTFASSLKTLRLGGRMVVVGNIVPERVQINLGALITRGLSLIGGSGATRTDMAELLHLHEQKPFTVPIDRVLPLSQADAAQRAVRAGGLKGRIVLVPSASG
ncbi:MAG: alcohol dehydrogenase catalytic domain-containing protein [Polyangiaceae bacterium]